MPSTEPDLLTVSQAAREKSASRSTIYRALEDGRLNGRTVAGTVHVVADATWQGFKPTFIGRRAERDAKGDQ